MKTIAIIPAGGKGKRTGSSVPKQYRKFNGKELIVYTLQVFQDNDWVDEIVLSAEPNYFELLEKIRADYSITKLSKIVEGGDERQDSVNNALMELDAGDDDLIVVHDAARALIPSEVLTNAVLTAKQKGNAVVCLKAQDTLVKGENTILGYINRDEVFYVQTPQIFSVKDLKLAMQNANAKGFYGTDESMLIKDIGIEVNIVEGSVLNFKVTTDEDIEIFEKLVGRKD
ncbi:MAG TPA: 2-C-methyl-D-erythritol 4-phosphate cytidylyltransferase [Ignavibacteriaceae bacterium]|jgi:2-C-methyl-D-erythritol 4-phosphate cytidylyltransferase